MNGSWKIEIAYDPRNISYAYVLNDIDNSFEACYMLEASKRYEGLSLNEITYWKRQERLLEKGQNHK